MEPSRAAELSQIHLDKLCSESFSHYHTMTNHCPLGSEEVAMTITWSYCKLIKNARYSQNASVAAVFSLKDEQRLSRLKSLVMTGIMWSSVGTYKYEALYCCPVTPLTLKKAVLTPLNVTDRRYIQSPSKVLRASLFQTFFTLTYAYVKGKQSSVGLPCTMELHTFS